MELLKHSTYTDINQTFDENVIMHYIMHGGGISIIRNSNFGQITVNIDKKEIPNLPILEDKFIFKNNKIPINILNQIINFFKQIHNKTNTEVLVEIYYNFKLKDYKAYCPKQTVSDAHLTRDPEDNFELCKQGYRLIMDIHSHNTMPAFWSSIDNNDETAFRLYGVIGDITNDNCQILIRSKIENYDINLNINDIFDNNLNESLDIPQLWFDNVSTLSLNTNICNFSQRDYIPDEEEYVFSQDNKDNQDDYEYIYACNKLKMIYNVLSEQELKNFNEIYELIIKNPKYNILTEYLYVKGIVDGIK